MSQPLPSPDRPIRGAGRRRSSSAWSSTPSSSLLARLAAPPPCSVRDRQMRPLNPRRGPPLNPLMPRLAGYMQEKANALREAAQRSGKPVFDFGIGDPREPTPDFIRAALRDAIPEVSQYPSIN